MVIGFVILQSIWYCKFPGTLFTSQSLVVILLSINVHLIHANCVVGNITFITILWKMSMVSDSVILQSIWHCKCLAPIFTSQSFVVLLHNVCLIHANCVVGNITSYSDPFSRLDPSWTWFLMELGSFYGLFCMLMRNSDVSMQLSFFCV